MYTTMNSSIPNPQKLLRHGRLFLHTQPPKLIASRALVAAPERTVPSNGGQGGQLTRKVTRWTRWTRWTSCQETGKALVLNLHHTPPPFPRIPQAHGLPTRPATAGAIVLSAHHHSPSFLRPMVCPRGLRPSERL